MAQLPGTVVSAQITTGDTANTFSIGDTNLMQGGHHTVEDLTARNAIPAERRHDGMTCWVRALRTMYQLVDGIDNANWQLAAAALNQAAYLANDQSTQSATAVSITGLAFNVGANQVWSFEARLGATVSAVAGVKVAVAVPSGATLGAYVRGSTTTVTPITSSGVLTVSVMTAAVGGIDINGVVQVGATAGTVQIQFASGDGTVTATIKGGQTSLTARRIT